MHNIDQHLCRVCGLYHPEEPWGSNGDAPSFNFCECCGVEFGYGDCTAEAASNWRKRWLSAGAQWAYPKFRTQDWSLERQLSAIGIQITTNQLAAKETTSRK